MAFDPELADRVRSLLEPRADLGERKMFGGIGFLVGGNMACGVMEDDLIVRLEPVDAERALSDPAARPFDFTGRPMKGWLFVAADGIADDEALRSWVEAGADYASGLPAK